jgi:hypothetical protein
VRACVRACVRVCVLVRAYARPHAYACEMTGNKPPEVVASRAAGGSHPFDEAAQVASPVPHLHRDWGRPCHIRTRTSLATAAIAPGLGSSLPHPLRNKLAPGVLCFVVFAVQWMFRSFDTERVLGKSQSRTTSFAIEVAIFEIWVRVIRIWVLEIKRRVQIIRGVY